MLGNALALTSMRAAFSPASIPNLQLWLDAQRSVFTDGGVQFVAAQGHSLSKSTNSTLQLNNNAAWTIACWVYLDSKTSNRDIIAKGGSATNSEYFLRYVSANDRLAFYTSDGTAFTTLNANTYGSPPLSTWIFIVATKRADGKMAISVNNGAFDVSATAPALVLDSTTAFVVGNRSVGIAEYMDGRMDSLGIWSRELTSGELTYLYNSGSGRTYADLGGMSSLLSGVISWWDFDEQTGTRNDSAGSNHLTAASALNLVDATTNNGGFETAGAGGADVFASWTEFVSGTATVNADTTNKDSGTTCLRWDYDATASVCYVFLPSILVPGVVYYYTLRAKVGTASGGIVVGTNRTNNLVTHSLTTSYATYSGSFEADGTSFYIKRNGGASNSIYIDTVVLSTNGPQCQIGVASGAASALDPIKTWQDQNSVGISVSQTSLAAKPTFATNTFGSMPGILFDGIDDMIGLSSLAISQPLTIVMVAKVTANPTGTWIDGNNGGGSTFTITTASNAYSLNAGATLSGGTYNTSAHVLTFVLNGASSIIRVDGTQVASGDAGSNAMTGLYLMATNADANSTAGSIGSVAVYNRALATAELSSLERSLGSRFGITVA